MDCPTCYGSGKVDDNFLTDEFVEQVFNEYYKIRGWHTAYGVESWEEYNDKVIVRNDTSARSCYNYEDVSIPLELFVRDDTLRASRIQADYDKFVAQENKKKDNQKKAEIKRLEQRLSQLKE